MLPQNDREGKTQNDRVGSFVTQKNYPIFYDTICCIFTKQNFLFAQDTTPFSPK